MRRKLYLLLFSLLGFNNIFSQQTTIVVDASVDGTTTNTCTGFIIDSGGQGGSGYSNNENTTFTVCPDTPNDIINVQFNLFNLDPTDQNPAPNITNVDQMSVYDGTSTSALHLGDYSGMGLNGVLIQCTPQNLTGCLTFSFYSNNVGNAGQFSASATCTTPCDDPTAGGLVMSGIANDSIHACIGETINFQEIGSFAQPGFTIAEYKWDFMDGSSTLGQNVSHTYNIPGHYRVQLFVTDNNGCTNNNLVDIDVLVATPPNFTNFQGDTTLCIGESMFAKATPLLYENTWSGFSGETTINNGCMTDQQLGVAQNVDIVQTGFSSGTTITNVNQILSLCMDMEHSFMGDLVISIACPNGQSVILHQQGGGGTQIGEPNPNDDVDCTDPTTQGVPYSYCFTSQATQTWVDYGNNIGGTIPAGDYQPIQSLGGLVGCPANGVWTLTVVDNWAADDGTVFSFALNLDPSMYPDVVEFTPEHGTNLDSSYWSFPVPFASNLTPDGDTMLITPTTVGTFTYDYTIVNSFGCSNDTSFNITVTQFILPVTLVDTTICAGNLVSMINGAQNNCNYTIKLYDSFGDGWNGNNLLVNSSGGTSNTYTIPQNNFAQFQIPVSFGDQLSFSFDGLGSFLNECSYEILDCAGQVVFNGASPLNTNTNNILVGVSSSEPISFVWSPANVFDTLANVPNPEIFVTDDLTVSLTVFPTAHPGCSASDNFNINVIPGSFVGNDSTVSICQTTTPENLLNYLGQGANPTGTWEDPNGNPIIMPIDPVTMLEGEYTYTVNTSGCIGSARITVNKFAPTITDLVISDATCVNANDGKVIVTGDFINMYSVGNQAPQLIQSPATILGFNEGFHTLTVYSSLSCPFDTTFFINDPDSLQITAISPNSVICVGDTTKLDVTVSGGSSTYLYSWSVNGTPISDLQSFDDIPSTNFNNYCVTLTETCGSTAVTQCTQIIFDQNIIPLLTSPDPTVCFGEEVIFEDISLNPNIASTTVSFGDGDTLNYLPGTTTFNHLYDSLKNYSLSIIVTSQLGCIYSNLFNNMISIKQAPNANFYVNPDIITTYEPIANLFSQSSTDAIKFEWDFFGAEIDSANTENATAKYPIGIPGEYLAMLTVENFYGCRDSITKTILIKDDLLMYIPNSFTPNGDIHNNVWEIAINGADPNRFSLQVFNRWGQLIFESNNPEVAWDGTYGNGGLVQDGIYQWRINGFNTLTNQEFERSGFLNVFK